MEHRTKRDPNLNLLVSDFENMIATGDVSYFNEKSYFQLIEYYEDESQIDKAIEVIDLALHQFQYRSEFYIAKARLLLQKNEIEETLSFIETAETIAPYQLEIMTLKARAYASRESYSLALNIIDNVKDTATPSDKLEICLTEAFVYECMGDYEAMFQALKKALIISPTNREALERIWISVELSKNYEESILLHKVVIEEFPYNHLGWFNLGHAHACVGEYEQAIDALEYSFLTNKDFEAGYIDCAELCFQVQEYARAKDIYEELNARFGPDAEYLVGVAHSQYQVGDYLGAKNNFKKALKIDPYNDEAYYLIANCHIKESNWLQALNALNQAIDLDDMREEYYHSLARCYVHLGDFVSAKKYYYKAAKNGVEQPLYWEEYISFLIKIGEFNAASRIINEAEKFTYSDKLIYCKAIISINSDQRRKGIEALEEALIENFDNHKFFLDLDPEMNNDKDVVSAIKYYQGEKESIQSNI